MFLNRETDKHIVRDEERLGDRKGGHHISLKDSKYNMVDRVNQKVKLSTEYFDSMECRSNGIETGKQRQCYWSRT